MRRGEVYLVDFGRGVGREVTGSHHAVVVSDDTFNANRLTAVVVPGVLTTAFAHRALGVQVTTTESGLPADTTFLCFLLRAVDQSRVKAVPTGQLPAARMDDIARILRVILDLPLRPPTSPRRSTPPPP